VLKSAPSQGAQPLAGDAGRGRLIARQRAKVAALKQEPITRQAQARQTSRRASVAVRRAPCALACSPGQ